MKKHWILIICIVVVLVAAAVITGVSLAIWRESKVKEATITEVEKTNPSLRFQLFHPIDSDGNLIEFRPYSVAIHGAILKNSYTVVDDLKAYDVYEKINGRYVSATYSKGFDVDLYVISGRHEYNADNDGYCFYSQQSTFGISLYVNNTGSLMPTNMVVDGLPENLYASVDLVNTSTEAIKTDYVPVLIDEDTFALTVDQESITGGFSLVDEADADLGFLTCTTMTSLGHEIYSYYEEDQNYGRADAETVMHAIFNLDPLYIMDYVSYDPDDADDVETYGELLFSQATGNNLRLYIKQDDSYINASSEQIELRSRIMYTGDDATYALATYEQLEAGSNLYYGNPTRATAAEISMGNELYYRVNSSYTRATEEQITVSSRIYYSEDASSYTVATPQQVSLGMYLYYSEDGQTFQEASVEQIATRAALYYLPIADVTPEQIAQCLLIYGGNITSSYALVGYKGTAVAEVVVPESIEDDTTGQVYPVTKICASPEAVEYTFRRNNIITAILIPSSVQSISNVAFGDMSSLRDIYFAGAGTVTIGDYAFLNCENLTNIYISSGITLQDSNGVELTWQSAVFTNCPLLTEESFKDFTTYEPLNSD